VATGLFAREASASWATAGMDREAGRVRLTASHPSATSAYHPRAKAREGGRGPNPSKGVSPERLLQPRWPDVLKMIAGGKARVRVPGDQGPFRRHAWRPAARRLLLARRGHGDFVTSTYYRDALHPWVAAYNKARPADAWVGQGLGTAAAGPGLRAVQRVRTTHPAEGKGFRPGAHVSAPDGRPEREDQVRRITGRCTTRRSATNCSWAWRRRPSTRRSWGPATCRTSSA